MDSALEWVLKTSVPIVSEVGLPVSLFWDVLKSLAAVDKTNVCAERGLWEKYPFVATLWSDLLEQTAKQHKATFAAISVRAVSPTARVWSMCAPLYSFHS